MLETLPYGVLLTPEYSTAKPLGMLPDATDPRRLAGLGLDRMTLIFEAQLWGPNASLSHLMPSDTQLTTDDHFAAPTSTQSALLHLTQIALTCMTLQDLVVAAKVHIIKPRQDLTHMPPPPPPRKLDKHPKSSLLIGRRKGRGAIINTGEYDGPPLGSGRVRTLLAILFSNRR
ncbi:hypothetical protein PG996_008029 [Apiospora saccharicola]|uniref:Uncharacterized protein n=1 Tax=Apiospora saccharicola TaxID=335842 RepID=A0ABR1UWS7_9PEZI